MVTQTPWGPSQTVEHIATGIIEYTTASHGGIHVASKLNKQMPESIRVESGWYEEDVDWVFVVVNFPQHFTQQKYAEAREIFRNLLPDIYERYYGIELKPGESYMRDNDP